MGKSANLKVNVTSNSGQAEQALGRISSQLTGIGKLPASTGFVAGLGVWANAIGTVTRAVEKVYAATKQYVDLYAIQAQAELRLQGTLRATGNQIGMTATELGRMASNLQSVTRFGDEAILPMQQILIATQKLTKDQLPMVIELALDMAEAMGTDGASAARVMAKALADPISGLESLKDRNIFFTQSEKDKVKELVNSNRLHDAQAIILDKVATAYGGIAREVAATDIGKMTQIKNLMGDIKEGLGEMIVGSIQPAFRYLEQELNRILGWLDTATATAAARRTAQDEDAALWNGEYGKISDDRLKEEIGKSQDLIAQLGLTRGTRVSDPYFEKLDAMIAELTRRATAARLTPVLTPPKPGETPNPNATQHTTTMFEDIWAATSATEAAQRKILTDRIALNEVLRDHLDLQVSANKMTEDERDLAEELLTQQIAMDRQTLQALGKKEEPKVAEGETATDYIKNNLSLSQAAQAAAIDANIAKAEGYLAAAEAGSAEEEQLKEIIAALREQKDLLGAVESRSAEAAKSMVSGWAKAVDSIYGLVGQVYQNQINQLESALDRQREAWDSYYADIQDKYKKDRDALDAQYQWGRISAEEYYSSLTALSDAKAQAEEENASAEEKLMERIDELKERQFNADKANSIIQATVAGALSIANIWKEWAANPVIAGVLTGLSAAAVGAQIATIASQQYTPMAEGGVATGPTHALIGEGGEPEMVLPLSKANEFGFGGSGGVINIIVNVGNGMYSRDEWVKIVFDAIERAQRTGALPRWRYAA
jgi:hypothetical protein